MNERRILIEEIYAKAQEENSRGISPLQNKLGIRHYLRIAEEIKEYLPVGSKILDWGCGYGQLSFFLRALGLTVIPYDICDLSKSSNFLEEIGINVLVNPNPSYLPLSDKSFDAVVSCGVLEHVPDEAKSLAEIRRILKDDGWLYICFQTDIRLLNSLALSWVRATIPRNIRLDR